MLPVATATIQLDFESPLPDDRYTLTLFEGVSDPPGNKFDGESNFAEPQETPRAPSGDFVSGGNFLARFTVDSRPEVGTVCCGGTYADINGNLVFDPEGQDNDATNRDLVFHFGESGDSIFAGNFAPAGANAASGFDKLAAYGLNDQRQYRFLLDFNHDGVVDQTIISAQQQAALPVAGNFAAGHPGDEIGLFDGDAWHLDSTGDHMLDQTINTVMNGLPVVGDFNGDGQDDLAVLDANEDTLTFDTNRDGVPDDVLTFGLVGLSERPLSGDLNLDGVDDIVLWTPGRMGQAPEEAGEFHFLISDRTQGLPSAIFNDFSPAPLGNDLFALFGDESAMPVLGNFDPPLNQKDTAVLQSNPTDPLDVNDDGLVSPIDALLVINQLNNGGQTSLGYLDVSGDGRLSAVDALLVIHAINNKQATAEGEPWAGRYLTPNTPYRHTELVDLAVGYDFCEAYPLPDENSLGEPLWSLPATANPTASSHDEVLKGWRWDPEHLPPVVVERSPR